LYTFSGGADGGNPRIGDLIIDRGGALYGTTSDGGTSSDCGVVFKLTPPTDGGTHWTETVLHSFLGGTDGCYPPAGVIMDANGALYGTTSLGGASGSGVVFKLTPPATGGTQWTETILYAFSGGTDGASPTASLIMDRRGTLYGTTRAGGTSGLGVVFQLTPPGIGQTQWIETVLHSFAGGNGDGAAPYAPLLLGEDGALYGATTGGGPRYYTGCSGTGCGIVFKLTPPARGQGQWTETVLHIFTNANGDGTSPYASLITGVSREKQTLCGTTVNGGTSGLGVVFKLTQ
jgi:uncharacterized repeat protein (TIGR03803 family)